jgi:hypothetical protein
MAVMVNHKVNRLYIMLLLGVDNHLNNRWDAQWIIMVDLYTGYACCSYSIRVLSYVYVLNCCGLYHITQFR